MGWPVLLAALVGLAGCADAGHAGRTLGAGDSHAPAAAGDAGSALRMARATRQAGDLAAAIVIYRSLVANTSVQPEVKVEFGDALLESGAPDDAIDIYSQVGAQSPARLAALLGMTRAWLDLGDPAKALEQADAARRLAPEDARVLVDRGVVLDSLERHAEAQQSYRAVLAVVPRHVSARNNLALSLALTGQFDEAIALMAPLVRSSAATPRVRGNMAVIYALKGDTEDAATMSKVDLDDSATRANLAFLAAARDPGP